MKRPSTLQYTLRDVPRAVDDALRRKSKSEGISLNKAAIDTLAAGLALQGAVTRHHDLDFLVGSWVEDAAFDEALESQRQIDPALWR